MGLFDLFKPDVGLIVMSAIFLVPTALALGFLFRGSRWHSGRRCRISQIEDGEVVSIVGRVMRISLAPTEHLVEGPYRICVSAGGIAMKEAIAIFSVSDGTAEVLVRIGPGAVNVACSDNLGNDYLRGMSFPVLAPGQSVSVSGLARHEPNPAGAAGYRDLNYQLVLVHAGRTPLRVGHGSLPGPSLSGF